VIIQADGYRWRLGATHPLGETAVAAIEIGIGIEIGPRAGARSYRARLGHIRESQAVYEGDREGFDPDPDFDFEQEPPS